MAMARPKQSFRDNNNNNKNSEYKYEKDGKHTKIFIRNSDPFFFSFAQLPSTCHSNWYAQLFAHFIEHQPELSHVQQNFLARIDFFFLPVTYKPYVRPSNAFFIPIQTTLDCLVYAISFWFVIQNVAHSLTTLKEKNTMED